MEHHPAHKRLVYRATSLTSSLCRWASLGRELCTIQVPNGCWAGKGGPSCWSCPSGPHVLPAASVSIPTAAPVCRLPRLAPASPPGRAAGDAPPRVKAGQVVVHGRGGPARLGLDARVVDWAGSHGDSVLMACDTIQETKHARRLLCEHIYNV